MRKLSAELEPLERTARAARTEREQLEASDGTPRARSVLAAAPARAGAADHRRRLPAEMIKLIVPEGGWHVVDRSGPSTGERS